MKVNYQNSVIEITNESDLVSAEFGQKFKKQYPTDLGIHQFKNDFIVHGETQVNRINENGEIIWDFSVRDIFVNPDGKTEFKIIENRIELIDW